MKESSLSTIFRIITFFLSGMFLISSAQAYIHTEPAAEAEQSGYSADQGRDKISLAIVGYNYTNRSIDDFTVNGIGGGNIRVSNESSGGGGETCCISYFKGTKARVVNVRWQVSACMRSIKIPGRDSAYEKVEYSYEEKSVQIDSSIPSDPAYLEVHFYPDGNVHAVITAQESAPRLRLKDERADRSDYPPCAGQL